MFTGSVDMATTKTAGSLLLFPLARDFYQDALILHPDRAFMRRGWLSLRRHIERRPLFWAACTWGLPARKS